MNPRTTSFERPFAGRRPHGGRWIAALACALVWFLILPSGDADAQRRRKRKRRRKAPVTKPVKKENKAPTKGTRGDAKPVSTPAPEAGGGRSGPAAPEQSDLADPGDGNEDDGGERGAKVRSVGKDKNTQVFDFTGLNMAGSERKPQLLYFLDRAQEELKRASLERRSFVPEMVRTMDEESL